jgi:beta-phosphoglucomutase-like phosphatase (HAD superfamily)
MTGGATGAGRAGAGVLGLPAVAVDRTGQADALRAHGADVVLGDLAELLDSGNRKAVR